MNIKNMSAFEDVKRLSHKMDRLKTNIKKPVKVSQVW